MNMWISCLLAISSGLLANFAYPPFNFASICWVAWTPLIASVWWGDSKKIPNWVRIFILGYLAGVSFFLSSLVWLCENTHFPPVATIGGWVALGLYLGIYPALWAVFIGTVGHPQKGQESELIWLNSWNNLRFAILGAAAWSALELLRGSLFTGFGWNAQGVALHQTIPLIQIADITGVYGLSFLIIMVNLILVMIVKRLSLEVRKYGLRPHFDFTLTLALIAGVFLYGASQIFRSPSDDLTPVRIACVQAAIPQILKWDPAFDKQILETYQKQSQMATQLQPHLLIWPEAATPHPALLDPREQAAIKKITHSFSGDFLIGTIHLDGELSFNSAVLFTHHGARTQLYSKMHLVPFGEYVPLRHSFPLFEWIAGTFIPSDFTPGQPVVFSMQSLPLRIAPLICFEDTVGSLARLFVREKPNFFAVLTNDGWFGRSAGSEQHLANAIFRTVESKLPMVRCANTGVTCFINRFGSVTQKLSNPQDLTFGSGILVGELQVPSHPTPTFYARFGDVFAISTLLLSCLAIILHLLNIKLHHHAATKANPSHRG